jgi:hypothetical protein
MKDLRLMDRRYQVKQYVAEVNSRFCRFRVFTTGDAQWYLFCALDPSGYDHGLHVPVRKIDLRTDVRHALRHGWGQPPTMKRRQSRRADLEL